MPRIGCLDEAAPAEFLGEAAADRRDRESLRRDKMREGSTTFAEKRQPRDTVIGQRQDRFSSICIPTSRSRNRAL